MNLPYNIEKLNFTNKLILCVFFVSVISFISLESAVFAIDDEEIIDITGLNYGILQITIKANHTGVDTQNKLVELVGLLEKNLLWSGYFDLRKSYEDSDLVLHLNLVAEKEIQAKIFSQEGTLLYSSIKPLNKETTIDELIIALVEEIIIQLTGEKSILKSAIAYVKRDQTNQYKLTLTDTFGKKRRTLYKDKNFNILPRWSPDASSILFTSLTGKGSQIKQLIISSLHVKILFSDLGKLSGGTWSKSGKQIILTLTKSGNPDLYLLQLNGGAAKRLTFRTSSESNPRWSPDGSRLLFVSNRSGTVQIYQRILASGEIFRMTFEGSYNVEPSWSNDGAHIVFSGITEEKKFHIFMMDREGEFVQQLTNGDVSAEQPVWSPNGRQILYVSKIGYDQKLFIIRADGSFKRRLTQSKSGISEFNPSWTANFLWK